MPKSIGHNDFQGAFFVTAPRLALPGHNAESKVFPAKNRPLPRVMRPPWIISVGVLCCLWPKSAARAQQALSSTLSLDSIIQAQQQAALLAEANTNPVVNLPPTVPHLGPVLWNLGVYSGLTSDDNINLSRNAPSSDLILGEGLNVSLNWPATARSALQFNSQLGYNTYLQHSEFNYFQISPGSALTWGFSLDDWDITFFDQFNYSRNVSAAASVSNISGIPILDNTTGARVQWHPGQWLLETGYSYDEHLSTSSAYNYLNFGANYFYARNGWRFSPNGTLGIEGSVSLTDYAEPVQPNSTSYSVGPYLEWQLDPAVHLSLHGGPTLYKFGSSTSVAAQNNLTFYYVSFELTHKFNQFLSEDLTIDRSVSPSYYPGSAYTEQFSAAYTVSYFAKTWLSFNLGLNYQSGQQPLQEFTGQYTPEFNANGQFIGFQPVFDNITENFDRYGFNLGVNYQLTQNIFASASYSHWTRGSNIPTDEYGDDQISAQLRYNF